MTSATLRAPKKPEAAKPASATPASRPRAGRKTKQPTSVQSNLASPETTEGADSHAGAPTSSANPEVAGPSEGNRRRTPEQQVDIARRFILPIALTGAIFTDNCIQVTAYRQFLDGLLEEAGSPTDPVEIMLLEQLAVCHMCAPYLLSRAGLATELKTISVYNAAATRVMAEFRKIALRLKEYRQK